MTVQSLGVGLILACVRFAWPIFKLTCCAKAWKPVPPDRPYVLVFQEPTVSEEGPLYQFVPDTEQRRDYVARIYELLAALGEIEDRYAGDVLTDILRQSPDFVSPNGPGVPLSAEPTSK